MNKYIELAIKEAKKAKSNDNIPVGTVIVKDNVVISKGYNKGYDKVHNHAEIDAINKAITKLKDWRLSNCELYVTLEPCPMCAGAIAKSRIKKVYIGTKSNIKDNSDIIKAIFTSKSLNSVIDYEYLDDLECSKLLTNYFKNKR